ncbi:hypothetical protein Ccrd_006622 [Cynara cardunculus var. scolymus]|uniref:Uncharacterized protein n=1 Tax=Cynara cardunculus var. scolymus TaxID=59895 RepID=A0A103XID5_CYNCS|nr:hypothetical protein Ccrd_006622 [Cynara cardunculus var. scolymus]
MHSSAALRTLATPPSVHRTINSPISSSTRSEKQTLRRHGEPATPPVEPTRSPSLLRQCALGILPAIPLLDPHNLRRLSAFAPVKEVDGGTTRNGGRFALKHMRSLSLVPLQNFPYCQNTTQPPRKVVDHLTNR